MASSNFPQILHSAVIIDRMMVVYGGNPYDHDNNVFKCHSAKLHVYDLGKLFSSIVCSKINFEKQQV